MDKRTLLPAGKTGSQNSHARISPSASDRVLSCTASLQLEQEHAEKIFLGKLDRTKRLIPYLETFPDELEDYEVRAIETIGKLEAGKLSVKKLTAEQRKDIERSEGSVASREGTRAHTFAEAILNGRRTIESIPEDFQVPVRHYVEYVTALVPEGEKPMIETEVPLWYSPGETGTTDFAVITDEKIIVADLKYGSGKLVYPTSNSQLAIYAWSIIVDAEETGLYNFEPDTEVEIHVVQPRHHEAVGMKPWVLTYKDLKDFCKEIEDKVRIVQSGEGLVFVPSDNNCQFCNVKFLCSARAEYLTSMLDNPDASYSGVDLLAELPDDDEIPDTTKKAFRAQPVVERLISRLEYASNGRVSALTDDQMVALWSNSPAIGKLLEDIEEHLKARVLGGEKIEGLKCVYGRAGDRKWKDEKAVMTFLRGQGLKKDEYTEEKLLGPAKVEKIPALAEKMENVKRTATTFANLISRSDAKKTIATLDDSRDEVSSLVDELPDDEEEDIDEDAMLG
jgi:ribosomal protein L17